MTRSLRLSVLLVLLFVPTIQVPSSQAAEIGRHSFPVGSEVISVVISGEDNQISQSPIVGDLVQVEYPVGTGTGKFACEYFFSVAFWHNNVKVGESYPSKDSLSKPGLIVNSPGTYEVEIIGESHCRNAGPKDLGASMNQRWVAFAAIEAQIPSKITATKMKCNPIFRISLTREYSYNCVTSITDRDHVADHFWITPADTSLLSPGYISVKYSSKSWKRTNLGWTISSTFKLLTVSPFEYSKLRSIERLPNRVDVEDRILDVKLGFNRVAEAETVNFIFPFKK